MLHHYIQIFVPELVSLIEIIGIIIIVTGVLKATYKYFTSLFSKHQYNIKIDLGETLALGLEFKLGAEILKTVIIREMSEIYILAAIIGLRALLTLLIHWEIKKEKEEHMLNEHIKEHNPAASNVKLKDEAENLKK